jgi:hypothetical protein
MVLKKVNLMLFIMMTNQADNQSNQVEKDVKQEEERVEKEEELAEVDVKFNILY